MLKCTLVDTDTFKSVINSIRPILDEANLVFNEDSMRLRSFDRAHQVLVDLYMHKDAFEAYQCDETHNIGLRIDDFSRILARSLKEDKIELFHEAETSTLTVRMSGVANREFLMSLSVVDPQELPDPADISLLVGAQLEPGFLKEVVADLTLFGEEFQLKASETKLFFFTTEGIGQTKIEVDASVDNSSLMSLNTDEKETRSAYELSYLKRIASVDSLADSVNMDFDQFKPLRLTFHLSIGTLCFVLAPMELGEEDDYSED